MAQSLEKYAESLQARKDLQWPAPPEPEPLRARPHLKKLPGIRVVLWSVYGTLLSISEGDLLFEPAHRFAMEVALEKTIQEFKMWKSMTRKPGNPADVMIVWYRNVIDEQKFHVPASEKYPDLVSHMLWAAIVKKLMTNEYTYMASQFGDLEQYGEKIAFFFHSMLQGTAAYAGAARTLYHLQEQNLKQGLLGNGQAFTWVQLQEKLREQEPTMAFASMIPRDQQFLSYELRARKPSDRLFKSALAHFAAQGIEPEQILHVGAHLHHDLVPARRLGMRTALFAGDRNSLRATTEELKNPDLRPDVMLTELAQVLEVVT